MATLYKEVWAKSIEENLFEKINKIVVGATNDGENLTYKTVNIPNAGAPATVLKNPSRPLTVAEREDVNHSYNINEYVMPPRLVKFLDRKTLPYDELKSLTDDVLGALPEMVMRDLLISWYTDGTYKVVTSGSNYTAHAPNATGNRKGLTLNDIMVASRKLDEQKLPGDDRFLFVDTAMFYQLLDVIGITTYRDAALLNQATLELPKLAGFQVIPVTAVVYVTASDVARAYGATGAATDNAVALAVHKSAISFAVGEIQIMQRQDDPIYVGNIISGAVLAGGKYRRADKKGVVPIIQAA